MFGRNRKPVGKAFRITERDVSGYGYAAPKKLRRNGVTAIAAINGRGAYGKRSARSAMSGLSVNQRRSRARSLTRGQKQAFRSHVATAKESTMRRNRRPSAKQLAARKRFAEMAKRRAAQRSGGLSKNPRRRLRRNRRRPLLARGLRRNAGAVMRSSKKKTRSLRRRRRAAKRPVARRRKTSAKRTVTRRRRRRSRKLVANRKRRVTRRRRKTTTTRRRRSSAKRRTTSRRRRSRKLVANRKRRVTRRRRKTSVRRRRSSAKRRVAPRRRRSRKLVANRKRRSHRRNRRTTARRSHRKNRRTTARRSHRKNRRTRRSHRRNYRRNRSFFKNSFRKNPAGIFMMGVIAFGGFAGAKILGNLIGKGISKLSSGSSAAPAPAAGLGSIEGFAMPLGGVLAAGIGVPLVMKFVSDESIKTPLIVGMTLSAIQGLAIAVLGAINPGAKAVLSGDDTAARLSAMYGMGASIMPHYAPINGMRGVGEYLLPTSGMGQLGEYFESGVEGLGNYVGNADIQQAAAGYGAAETANTNHIDPSSDLDRELTIAEAAAGVGQMPYQAAAGMGIAPYAAQAGMGEYFESGMNGLGNVGTMRAADTWIPGSANPQLWAGTRPVNEPQAENAMVPAGILSSGGSQGVLG